MNLVEILVDAWKSSPVETFGLVRLVPGTCRKSDNCCDNLSERFALAAGWIFPMKMRESGVLMMTSFKLQIFKGSLWVFIQVEIASFDDTLVGKGGNLDWVYNLVDSTPFHLIIFQNSWPADWFCWLVVDWLTRRTGLPNCQRWLGNHPLLQRPASE